MPPENLISLRTNRMMVPGTSRLSKMGVQSFINLKIIMFLRFKLKGLWIDSPTYFWVLTYLALISVLSNGRTSGWMPLAGSTPLTDMVLVLGRLSFKSRNLKLTPLDFWTHLFHSSEFYTTWALCLGNSRTSYTSHCDIVMFTKSLTKYGTSRPNWDFQS